MGYVPKKGDRVRVVGRNDLWDGAVGTALGFTNKESFLTFHEVTLDEGRGVSGERVAGGSTWAQFCTGQLEKIEPVDTNLEDDLQKALYAKYALRAPEDANWLARDDAAVILRNLDVILPILERHRND